MSDVHLKEFEKLKDEQVSREAHRDRLFHLTIILIGGGITLAFSKSEQSMGILLLIPVVAFIAGMSHIACDRRISSIGAYFRDRLAPMIAKDRNVPREQVFGWEDYIRSDSHRSSRKRLQLLSNLLLYVGSGLWAALWYVFFVKPRSPVDMGWLAYAQKSVGLLNNAEFSAFLFDMLLMVVMAWQLFSHAYIYRAADTDASVSTWQHVRRAMLRFVFATLLAALAATAITHYDHAFIQEAGRIVYTFRWNDNVLLGISRLDALAACLALGVWSIGMLATRR